MSAWTNRQFDGKAVRKIVPPCLRIPWWKGLGADSEEKHEPVSDIDSVVVDSLKARLTLSGRLEKRTCRARLVMSQKGYNRRSRPCCPLFRGAATV